MFRISRPLLAGLCFVLWLFTPLQAIAEKLIIRPSDAVCDTGLGCALAPLPGCSSCADLSLDGCTMLSEGCCGGGCGDTCGGGCGSGCGLLRPSDHCFDDFISPMINFVFFEDPRNLTELRPIFVNHWVPGTIGSNIPAGGTIELYAAQFRVALTERLSLIAVKDGFIVDHTQGALDTLLNDGWASVTAGLKYNLFRDPRRGKLTSAGFTYEIPIGSRQALQYVGNGEFHIFLTHGQRLLGGLSHWLTSVGYRIPVDEEVQNSAIHWSNHLDYRILDRTYLFTEFAWWHWTQDASRGLPLGVAGQDLFNLPATNVVGNDLLTQNVGLKFKPSGNSEVGLAYEFPLTDFKDVIQGRLMVDWILRY